MLELLNKESWTLDTKQLVEKRNQIRKLEKLLFIPFMLCFGVGYFTWILTDMIMLPILAFMFSIIFIILFSTTKLSEYIMTSIICNKIGKK